MTAEAIHRLVQDDPRPDHGYSQTVRDAVGRYARQRRDEGARWSEIAAEVGVSDTSARTWMRALEPQPQRRGFHQVVVVDPPVVHAQVSDLVLTSPSGFSLTGFSLEQAVALLRSLQ